MRLLNTKAPGYFGDGLCRRSQAERSGGISDGSESAFVVTGEIYNSFSFGALGYPVMASTRIAEYFSGRKNNLVTS